VNNCIIESVSAAIKLGTGSSGDFRDIKVSNCVLRNSGVGLGIFIKDGGTAERLSFSDISIETTPQGTQINSRLRNNIIPIYIDIEKRDEQSRLGAVRNVSFSNIQIASDNGILIQGMPERPVENLSLRNISFRVTEAFDFSRRTKRAGGRSNPKDARITTFIRQPTYVALAYVNGLTLDNLRVVMDEHVFQQYGRSALALFESSNAVIRNVQRQPAGSKSGQPVLTMRNCEHMLVSDCLPLPGTPAFLGLSGDKTKNISLIGNELGNVATPVIRSPDVAKRAVRITTP
jgi:polygalacturonase